MIRKSVTPMRFVGSFQEPEVTTYTANGFGAEIVGPGYVYDFQQEKTCWEGHYIVYIQIPHVHPMSRTLRSLDDFGDFDHIKIPFFYQGISSWSCGEFYDTVCFDTANTRCNLFVPLGEQPQLELVRNTWESVQNDPPDLRTIKTKAFVEDCLNLATQSLALMYPSQA